MTHTLTVPRSLEHIFEAECSPRVVAMSSYLQLLCCNKSAVVLQYIIQLKSNTNKMTLKCNQNIQNKFYLHTYNELRYKTTVNVSNSNATINYFTF